MVWRLIKINSIKSTSRRKRIISRTIQLHVSYCTFDGDGDPASAQIGRQISFEEAGMVTLYSSRQFHQSGYQSYDAQSSHTSIDDEQPSFASPGTRPSERNRIRNRVESAIGSPGREVQQLSPQRSLLSSLDQHWGDGWFLVRQEPLQTHGHLVQHGGWLQCRMMIWNLIPTPDLHQVTRTLSPRVVLLRGNDGTHPQGPYRIMARWIARGAASVQYTLSWIPHQLRIRGQSETNPSHAIALCCVTRTFQRIYRNCYYYAMTIRQLLLLNSFAIFDKL